MAKECFDTDGGEQDWKGRLFLWEDDDDGSNDLSSGDDDDGSELGSGDVESDEVVDEEWWSVDSNNGDGMVEVSGDSGVGESWGEVEDYGDINVEMDSGREARRDDCDIGSGGGGEEKCCTDQEARECVGVEERREEEQLCACGGSNDNDGGVGTSNDCGGNGGGEGESKRGIDFSGEERQYSQKGGRTTEVDKEHNHTSPQTRAASSMTPVLQEEWDKIDSNIPLNPNWL